MPHLEEIGELPPRVMSRLDRDIGNLKVYLVQDFDLSLLRRMVEFGVDLFGAFEGMDEWGIVSKVRHGNVFLLKEDGRRRIIGRAVLMRDWEDVDKAYLLDYAIAEGFQGRGLGRHFLEVIRDHIKGQGFRRISLTVDTNNTPAIKLYTRMGFQVRKMLKDEYGEGQDRYLMRLEFHFN